MGLQPLSHGCVDSSIPLQSVLQQHCESVLQCSCVILCKGVTQHALGALPV